MTDTSHLWPDSASREAMHAIRQKLLGCRSPALKTMPDAWLEQWEPVWSWVAAWAVQQKQQLPGIPIIGIHGGQGSGKSTLSRALSNLFRQAYGWNIAVVSIDDIYLTHQERQTLSQDIHPLLATRGVPGTHDHTLGQSLFQQLRQLEPGDTLHMPRFDKVSDDRLPETHWHQITGPVDLILFEGWCVGCQAVPEEQLLDPINTLESTEDSDKLWRTQVNHALSHDYKDWFSMIDSLIMLKVPGMEAVFNWRKQQEQENRQNTEGNTDRSMDDAALSRFIQHYERLTRNALRDLPEHADLVLQLNNQHAVSRIELPV